MYRGGNIRRKISVLHKRPWGRQVSASAFLARQLRAVGGPWYVRVPGYSFESVHGSPASGTRGVVTFLSVRVGGIRGLQREKKVFVSLSTFNPSTWFFCFFKAFNRMFIGYNI